MSSCVHHMGLVIPKSKRAREDLHPIGLHVWIPFLPPSSNAIYVNIPRHGRTLSTQARAFKVKSMREIQQQGRVAFMQLKTNVPYQLSLTVFFDKIELKKSEKGNRYVVRDLSNVVKLIEDTVAEAVGIGDEHNFRLVLEKHCDPENPGMYVDLVQISEDRVGLTKKEYDGHSVAT